MWLPDLTLYLALLLVGIFWLVTNIYHVLIYEPFFYKPTTTGTIVTATFIDVPWRDDGYLPKIEFTYKDNGVTYTKSAIEDIDRSVFFDTAKIHQLLTKYPIGMKIPVYYIEGEPEQAIFQSGIGAPFNDSHRRLIYIFWDLVLISFVTYAALKRSDYYYDYSVKEPYNPFKRFFDLPRL